MNVYQKAVDVFGHDLQILQASAEMSELSAALSQYLSQSGKRKQRLDEIFEEIADVEIMLKQLRIIFGDYTNKINDIKAQKVQKLREILNGEHTEYLAQRGCKGEHGCAACDAGCSQG